MMKVVIVACLLMHCVYGAEDRYLSLPQKKLCEERFMGGKYEGKNFFYTGHDPELKDVRLDWLDARNECRKRCMETISFQTQAKFDFFKDFIQKHNISFIWTSGRICDFAGCEGRWDLLPKIIKGWLWSADQSQLDDTNRIPKNWSYQPWSKTGHIKKPQPDNAEYYISQTRESCLGVLNNQYNDSVSWHDVACYHRTRFICEDSLELLEKVKNSENKPEETTLPSKPTTIASTASIKTSKLKKVKETTKTTSSTKAPRIFRSRQKPLPDSDQAASLKNEAPETTTEDILGTTSSTKAPRVFRSRQKPLADSDQAASLKNEAETTTEDILTTEEIPGTFEETTSTTTTTTTKKPKEFSRATIPRRRRTRSRTTTVELTTTTKTTEKPEIGTEKVESDSTEPSMKNAEETTLSEEVSTTTTTSATPKYTRFPLRRRKNRKRPTTTIATTTTTESS